MKNFLTKALVASLFISSLCFADKANVLLVAGKKSHGYNAHEHNAGSLLLAKLLNESGLEIDASVYYNEENPGWPTDKKLLKGIDSVVIYCDGGNRHVANNHVGAIDALQAKGVGVGSRRPPTRDVGFRKRGR